jgi:hypothetical protein
VLRAAIALNAAALRTETRSFQVFVSALDGDFRLRSSQESTKLRNGRDKVVVVERPDKMQQTIEWKNRAKWAVIPVRRVV